VHDENEEVKAEKEEEEEQIEELQEVEENNEEEIEEINENEEEEINEKEEEEMEPEEKDKKNEFQTTDMEAQNLISKNYNNNDKKLKEAAESIMKTLVGLINGNNHIDSTLKGLADEIALYIKNH
ncbi:merozoite surface protein 3,putative, partial [Plasmodium sp. gorilla clade G3]